MKEENTHSQRPPSGSGSKESQNWLIGRVLGKYRLEKSIGSGAFATIYEAVHIHLNVPFAIKILHPAFMNHEEVVTRFFREAQAASQLQHENVVFIADFDVEEDVGPYIVMEYLDGNTLKHLIGEEGALPLELVGELSRQICQVLGLAHRKGIVHRDLKPENIFLVAREMGRVLTKILDFGIAHLAQNSENITGARLMGTPIYMAPEQFRGASNSPSLDIYSFGVILYEMLTGGPPFQGQNVQQLGIEHLLIPAPELAPTFPSGLRQLQARLLAKTPEERPSNMEEVWDLLAPALDPEGRYPHWHRKEPRLTSASMPALASLSSKNSIPALDTLSGDEEGPILPSLIPPKRPGDTWDEHPIATSFPEDESATAKYPPIDERMARAASASDMSDTIMSDEEFSLTDSLSSLNSKEEVDLKLTELDSNDEPDFIPDDEETVVARKNHLLAHAQQILKETPTHSEEDDFEDALSEDELLSEEHQLEEDSFLQEEGSIKPLSLEDSLPSKEESVSDTGEVELVVREVWKTSEVPIADLDDDELTEPPTNGGNYTLPERRSPREQSANFGASGQAKLRVPISRPSSLPPVMPSRLSFDDPPSHRPSSSRSSSTSARREPNKGPTGLVKWLLHFEIFRRIDRAFNRKEKRILSLVAVGVVLAFFFLAWIVFSKDPSQNKKKGLQSKSRFIDSPHRGRMPDARMARVNLVTEPSNVVVYKDGLLQGRTPLILHTYVGLRLKLVLSLDGFNKKIVPFKVKKNVEHVFVRMTPR